jgi:hypothetical protein
MTAETKENPSRFVFHLGGAEPSEEVAVERVVAEGDQVAELPEDRAREPVVVVTHRDVPAVPTQGVVRQSSYHRSPVCKTLHQ